MLRGSADAIINLGGGLNAQGELSPRNYQRLDTTHRLYREGVAPNIITTGGWGLLDQPGEKTESEQGKEYLVSEGVPEEVIFTESTSRESIGNPVFAKKQILIPKGWRNVIAVTSETHLPRGVKAVKFVCGDDYGVWGAAAPEDAGIKEKVWETVGTLVFAYVTLGIEPGDHEAIERRLIERVPGYGSEVTNSQLATNSLKSFFRRPHSVRL